MICNKKFSLRFQGCTDFVHETTFVPRFVIHVKIYKYIKLYLLYMCTRAFVRLKL